MRSLCPAPGEDPLLAAARESPWSNEDVNKSCSKEGEGKRKRRTILWFCDRWLPGRGGQGLRMRDPEDGNLLACAWVVGFTITPHSFNAEMLWLFPASQIWSLWLFPCFLFEAGRLSLDCCCPGNFRSNLGFRRHLSGLQSLPNCHPCCRMLKKPPPARQPHFPAGKVNEAGCCIYVLQYFFI